MNTFGYGASLLAAALVALPVSSMAGIQNVQPSAAAQINVLRSIKSGRTPAQNKIDSRLNMAILHQRGDARLNALPDFRYIQPDADGRIEVEILVASANGVKAVTNLLDSLGEQALGKSYRHPNVSARVRLQNLETVAALAEVRKVRQPMPKYTNAVNVSEGDKTHSAELARNTYGVTGAGVKVCVLSDGVDSLATSQGTGDLPAVDVLPGQAGTGDEGTAMLEIVHDLAPGASLGFATAFIDEPSFAQNILDLATSGCHIIVDDVIYLDESPFEDGPVAQAVNTVTGNGVLYFSSAGNEGNKDDLTSGTWEGDFLASAAADPAPLSGANLHDFGDGGNSILVESGGGNPPLLIWAEHYDFSSGVASTDFDLYDMDGGLTTIFDASTDVQDGAGGDDWPIEFIGGGTFAGERLLIDKFAAGTTSSVPMFNLIVFRGELDDNLSTRGATRGHSAAADAMSVAATPAAASFDGVTLDGPYPGAFSAANESESFSSDGDRRIILDGVTGTELCAGNRTSSCAAGLRQKPNITAADGVSTSAPGFNPFYGTSAAAPHAAAIAALIKSSVPGLTPVQIVDAMVSTAIDIETPGIDPTTGVGIVMADAALAYVGAPTSAVISAGAAVFTEVQGDGDADMEQNEIWGLTIPLTNVGAANATSISGTLTSSTAGIQLLSNLSSYPDLAPTASANNDQMFVFYVGSDCGAVAQFTLTASFSGGPSSPASFDVAHGIGEAGAPQTFSYAGSPVAIPDGADLSGGNPGAPVSATLPAVFSGNLIDVNFSIDGSACSSTAGSTTVGIDHTFVNDLRLTLISPSNTQVTVINNTDGSGNNFCQTILDDEGGGPSIQSVVSGQAPFSGNFTPSSALSAYAGEPGNGNWQLQAQDFFAQDTGNIRAFSVTLTPAVCNAPVLNASVTATKYVAGAFMPGGAVTYTVVLANAGTGPALDNAGDEFVDVLPAELDLVSASASSGTALATLGTNTVTWNGSIGAGSSVTITIQATIKQGTAGATVINQGVGAFDSNLDGSNDTQYLTDGDGANPGSDPTIFAVNAIGERSIPALTPLGLLLLSLMMAAFGMRRRKA